MSGRILKNQRGDTLVGVLIAVVVLVVCALGVGASMLNMTGTQQRVAGPMNSCREMAQDTMSAIRSNGAEARSVWTPIDSRGGGVLLSSGDWHRGNDYNPDGVRSELGAIPDRGGPRWPNVYAIENWNQARANPNVPYRVNTPLLIMGSMNAMLSVYNSDPQGFCRSPNGVLINNHRTLRTLVSTRTINNRRAQTYVSIRPYDLHSGAFVNCTPNLRLRPYANVEPPPAQAAGVRIFSYDDYRPDLGLQVQVHVELERREREPAIACNVRENFQFDRRSEPVGMPVLVWNGRTLNISMPTTEIGPGNHLVCKEHHRFMLQQASVDGQIPNVNEMSPTIYNEWMPCNRMRVCGDNPTVAIDRDQRRMRLSYSFAANCFTTVEARVIDPVGNMSELATAPLFGTGYPTNPIPDQWSIPYSDGGGSARGGYEVAGQQFETPNAAQAASQLTGEPVRNISQLTQPPMDIQMNRVDRSIGQSVSNRNAAQQGHYDAQQANIEAQSYASIAANPMASKASATTAASQAQAAADRAGQHAVDSRAAADRAQQDYDRVSQQSRDLGIPGGAALDEAQAARDFAADEATKAEEEHRKAQEAADKAKDDADDKT